MLAPFVLFVPLALIILLQMSISAKCWGQGGGGGKGITVIQPRQMMIRK